jgi:ribonuclease HI
MKKISLFSDGSSLGNPGFGGYCAIVRYRDNEKIVSGSKVLATNNQMELLAVIEGLRVLKEPCKIHVVSDSSYVVKGINEWLPNWVKKNFAKVKNPQMWQDYLNVAKIHNVEATWVRGHNGHPENEKCDKIARLEAENLKSKEY